MSVITKQSTAQQKPWLQKKKIQRQDKNSTPEQLLDENVIVEEIGTEGTTECNIHFKKGLSKEGIDHFIQALETSIKQD